MTEYTSVMKHGYGDMRGDETISTDGAGGLSRWLARRRGCMAWKFWRERCASVALDSAAVVTILVVATGGLMEIFSSAYMNDTMNRAARAAARAIALSPDAHNDATAVQALACAAAKRELDLGDQFDCDASWQVTVDTGLTTEDLLDGKSPKIRTGDMVRINIAWQPAAWGFNPDQSDSSGNGGQTPKNSNANNQPDNSATTPRRVSTAVARAEPELEI